MTRIDSLRQTALEMTRCEQYESALPIYDELLALVSDDEIGELVTINKADALIALGRSGPEVQQLPAILLRRRNLHHAFLAAYALMFKHRLQKDHKRGIFYGTVALEAGIEAGEPLWQLGALNELGNIYEVDSQFEQSVGCFERALALIDRIGDGAGQEFGRAAICSNLGYGKMQLGQVAEGIEMIRAALDNLQSADAIADAHLDLCFGYLQIQAWDEARAHGEIGLARATEERVVRNGHYLLGEVALNTGNLDAADFHFGELARYYPQFRNLKNLLFAIDFRGMVNFRL